MNFISPAYAQAAAAAPGGQMDLITSVVPLLAVVVIMYFLVLRPQQQRAKESQNMQKNVRRGDVVTTSGGLIGKVTKTVDDSEVEVEIAANTRVRLLRSGIADVRSKSEPVKD
ncbi:MAG: preprotein translocase subunit YajC [Hyphomicrobiales bacterium]|nr:preprotein translocase subunit YajC [Hyphomicrobiales bacterium]MDE2114848.1 preprotein translocase subunit YajC [Hyphomicrobiales bacterium]